MRVAIYSPYLDTAGGGEKYMLTIAEVLSSTEHVEVLLDAHLMEIGVETIRKRITEFHGLDLSRVQFVPAPIGAKSSGLDRLLFMCQFDWLFYLTDGSVFYSTAKNNVIHFQVPFSNPHNSVKQKIKLSSWKIAIYNSQFTKDIIEKTWPIKGPVIYPPVSVDLFKPAAKKNKQILSVGRFFGYDKSKKHSFLIESFLELLKNKKCEGWSLHLAGGASEGDQNYLAELKKLAKNKPVVFHPNISLKDLIALFNESAVYWHAKGFGETDPTKMEHFGITTVEAMAAGCVPVVIKLGGQAEIVDHDHNGFLWSTQEECLRFTTTLLTDSKKREQLSTEAIKKSQIYSKERFAQHIKELVTK